MTDAKLKEISVESIEKRQRKRLLSYHDTPMVEVVVGGHDEPEHIFHIHEGVLIKNSDFFKSALQPYFTSGVQKKICLPDVSPDDFSTFAKWVYDKNDLDHGNYVEQAKSYVLAERLIAPALKKDLLQAFKSDIEDAVLELSLSEMCLMPLDMDEVIEVAQIVYA